MLLKLIQYNDKLLNVVRILSLWFARFSGLLLLIAIMTITFNVATRSILGYSMIPATELSGYILAISVSMALAYTLLCKGHIRIDAVYQLFPSRARRMLDILALSAFLLFIIVIFNAAWEVANESIVRNSLSNTPLQVPLWIPQTLWVFGLGWFLIVIILMLFRTIFAAINGDMETIRYLAGNEEIIDNESIET